MKKLEFTVVDSAGEAVLSLLLSDMVIAGWAGRDQDAMEHHIKELEALGVARPASTPTFYRVAASRLSQEPSIQDAGPDGSGEVEVFLVSVAGKLYVGIGSDHTDRKVETIGVTISKQVCDKPVSSVLWPYEEVADHWDNLILRSYAFIDGEKVLYQEGTTSGLLAPSDLIERYTGHGKLADGTAMFCGTMPAIGGIRPATRFEGEVIDPVLGRSISFAYDVEVLPVRG
jgi:hypothetical protein